MTALTFLRDNARWIGGGFLLCFFSSFGQTFFISLSGGEIRTEYGLSNGEWGSLYMLATLASAATLTWFGRIVDRLSIAATTAIIVPMLGFACLLMSWSRSVVLLGLTLYLLRLFGQGMMTHTAMTAMGRWYAARRGTAVSVATVGLQGGEAALPIAMVSLFAAIGWRQSWLAMGALLVLVALPVIYALMRVERVPGTNEGSAKPRTARDWTRGEVMRDGLFWLLMTGILAPSFIGTTIFFHQAYLVELRGWQLDAFAAAFAVMAALTVLFALVSGQLVDRFGAPAILPFFLLPLAASCFTLALIADQSGIFVFMVLMGISYGISSTLFGALWPEIYGTLHLGGIRAITVATMVLSSALGPGISGVLIDAGISYLDQIFVMGLWCLAASAVMLFVARKLIARSWTHKQDRNGVETAKRC